MYLSACRISQRGKTVDNPKNQRSFKPDDLLTSHEVGQLLQVVPSSVVKWVNDGLLPAFRTPGGHRRIRSADLVAFLRSHKMYIPPPLAKSQADNAPVRALLVDDDRHVLTALQRGMKSYRDRVSLTVLSSGIEALVMVGAEKPDALIIDMHMPEMDGLEVCTRLRRHKHTQVMDVVMMTGRYSQELERKCLEAGARALLVKPLTASKLVEVLTGERPSSRSRRS
jgi:excisionase family DNA binding protein